MTESPTAAPSSRAPPPPPLCSRPAPAWPRRATATATAIRAARRCRLRGVGAPHPAMDRAPDHRRRAAATSRRAPITWPGSRPRPASPACARCRPAASRPCSACSTPARRAPSASISCTTSSSSIRPNGPRRRSRGGSSTTSSAARSAAAARSTRRGRKAAFLAALHAFRAANRRLPVNLVLLAEGRGGDRLAPFPQRVRRCRGARGDAAGERGDHPLGLAGRQRRGADQPRRQGHHRMRAGLVGRALGPGPRARHPLEPQGAGRQPGLAPGRGAADPGDRPRQPAGDRRLVRACPAADARASAR